MINQKPTVLEQAEALMLLNADDVKKQSMQWIEYQWHDLTGKTAPKWSSKQVAAERLLKEATNTFMSDKPNQSPNPFVEIVFDVKSGDHLPIVTKNDVSTKTTGRPPATKKMYTFIHDPSTKFIDNEPYKRLPKQAKCILINIKPGVYPEKELLIHIMALHSQDKLTTKQDPWRIFQYYRSAMIQGNFLKMSNA